MLFNCLPENIIRQFLIFMKYNGVPIETINQMWFLENLSEGNKNIFDFIKRITIWH